MDPMLIARSVAIGRVGFGIVLSAAPLRLTRAWLGGDAQSEGAQVLARSLGMRDVALGAGALTSDRDGLPRWLLAGVVADASDLVGTLAADSLPRRGRILGSLAAAGGIALGVTAVALLRRS